MSIDRGSSSTSSRQSPALPPFLHLAIPHESDAPPDRREGSKLTIKKFRRALHSIMFSERLSTVDRLEKVAEAAVEDEDADVGYSPVSLRSTKLKKHAPPASPRPSMSSIRSQPTSSHFPATRNSPHTLITSFPSLNVADMPSKCPTYKSPFSTVLLSAEGEECEDDDLAHTLWRTGQVHRARLAKLTRHLGEEIPADLVMSPPFLSRGASTSSLRHRRGERSHHRRRSLDPSALLQDAPVADPREANLRRNRSLKGRDAIPPNTFPGSGEPEKEKEDCKSDTSKGTETTHCPDLHVTSLAQENAAEPLNDQLPTHDRASMETYSDSIPTSSTCSSIETYSETSHSSPRRSPRARTLPRRPATAGASRRMEKLANFFGIDHNDLSAVSHFHGAGQRLQFSAEAAGDLAIDVHATNPQLEADVKFIKPSRRFWNLVDGGGTTKAVHPDDVMNRLRTMRAS